MSGYCSCPNQSMSSPSALPKALTLPRSCQWFRCPDCQQAGVIDEDQAEGRVSIQCPNCSFHRTGKVRPLIPSTQPTKPEDMPASLQ